MNYASIPLSFQMDYCGIDNNTPWIILVIPGNIPLYYLYRKNHWEDYHTPPTILTEKINAFISKTIKYLYPDCHHVSSNYSVTKFLLTKEIFIQNEIPYDVLVYMIHISD